MLTGWLAKRRSVLYYKSTIDEYNEDTSLNFLIEYRISMLGIHLIVISLTMSLYRPGRA